MVGYSWIYLEATNVRVPEAEISCRQMCCGNIRKSGFSTFISMKKIAISIVYYSERQTKGMILYPNNLFEPPRLCNPLFHKIISSIFLLPKMHVSHPHEKVLGGYAGDRTP